MNTIDLIGIAILVLILIIHLALNLYEDERLIKAYEELVNVQDSLIDRLLDKLSEKQPATPTVESPGENG